MPGNSSCYVTWATVCCVSSLHRLPCWCKGVCVTDGSAWHPEPEDSSDYCGSISASQAHWGQKQGSLWRVVWGLVDLFHLNFSGLEGGGSSQDQSSEVKGWVWRHEAVWSAWGQSGSRQFDFQEELMWDAGEPEKSNFLHVRVAWCQPFSPPFPPDAGIKPQMLCTSTHTWPLLIFLFFRMYNTY